MNGTIDTKETPEFSAGFLRWLFSLTIVVLLLVFFLEPRVSNRVPGQNDYLMPAGVIAGWVRVEQGIQEFHGNEIGPVDSGKRMQVLMYLLVTFAIVPACFLFLIRTSEADPAGSSPAATVTASLRTILLLLCITVASIVFISTVVSSVKSPAVFKTMKSDNAASEERDMLVKDLVLAYNDVIRYHYQTKQFGGKKKNLKEVRLLAELGIPETTGHGTLHLQPIVSDTLVIIAAVGNTTVGDGGYRNIDGSSGRIQYAVHISPLVPRHTIERNN